MEIISPYLANHVSIVTDDITVKLPISSTTVNSFNKPTIVKQSEKSSDKLQMNANLSRKTSMKSHNQVTSIDRLQQLQDQIDA